MFGAPVKKSVVAHISLYVWCTREEVGCCSLISMYEEVSNLIVIPIECILSAVG